MNERFLRVFPSSIEVVFSPAFKRGEQMLDPLPLMFARSRLFRQGDLPHGLFHMARNAIRVANLRAVERSTDKPQGGGKAFIGSGGSRSRFRLRIVLRMRMVGVLLWRGSAERAVI